MYRQCQDTGSRWLFIGQGQRLKADPFLMVLRKIHPPNNVSRLHISEKIIFWSLSHPVCSALLQQPQQTNIASLPITLELGKIDKSAQHRTYVIFLHNNVEQDIDWHIALLFVPKTCVQVWLLLGPCLSNGNPKSPIRGRFWWELSVHKLNYELALTFPTCIHILLVLRVIVMGQLGQC